MNGTDTLNLKKINITKIEVGDKFFEVQSNGYNEITRYGVNIKKIPIKNNSCFSIFINKSPFHNCQISSIAEAAALTYIEDINVKNTVLQQIQKYTSSQIMIDVIEEYIDELKEILLEYSPDGIVVWEQSYQNPTGSDMVTLLFKWEEDYITEDHPDNEGDEWDDEEYYDENEEEW